MPKPLQIDISKPCQEDWDKMAPLQQGRFCDSCQHQVVDFTQMSDRQLAEFFKKPSTGSLCGRFMSDQLERDIALPKKRLPWVRHFFQVALPMFLLSVKPGNTKAQMGKPSVTQSSCSRDSGNLPSTKVNIADTVRKPAPEEDLSQVIVMGNFRRMPSLIIRGTVMNAQGEPMPNASIYTKNGSSSSGVVMSDSAGNYTFKIYGKADTILLAASFVGFEDQQKTVTKNNRNNVNFFFEKITGKTEEDVVVVARHRRKNKNVVLVKDHITKKVNDAFSVYPNPVQAGSNINIELKQIEAGNYLVTLLNQSGQLILQQAVLVSNTATKLFSLSIPTVIAGNYFIVMSNKKTGKSFSRQVLVQ